MHYCYIIYSQHLDRYYIGATSLETEVRLEHHLSKYYADSKFTAKANDWVLFLSIPCLSFQQARNVEKQIKKMKSKIYIDNLKRYPEMIEKLIHNLPDS